MALPADVVSQVASKLVSLLPGLYINPKNELGLNHRPINYGTAFWQTIKKHINLSKFIEDNPSVASYTWQIETNGEACDQIRAKVKSLIEQRNAEEKAVAVDLTVSGADNLSTYIPHPIHQLKIIENPYNHKYVSIYHEPTDTLYRDLDARQQDAVLARKLPKEALAEFYATNVVSYPLKFKPHHPRFFKEKSSTYCNIWQKPEWMKDWTPDPSVTALPKETEQFFDLLTKVHKKEILAWLKSAVFERAELILILRGASGIGKNMLIENLARPLIGAENYRKGPRGFSKSQFHGFLSEAQIVYWDESEARGSMKQTLKDYHNSVAALEEKFQKVGAPSDIPCSMALSTNYKRNVKMEYNDRKFFVPTLSDENLQDAMGVDWPDQLVALWKDPEYLRQIASYLHCQVKTIRRFPVRTPQFLELCWLHLPEYFKKFLKLVVTEEEVTDTQFFKRWPKGQHKVSLDTLSELLSVYEVGQRLGEGGMGRFEEGENGWIFKSRVAGRSDLIFIPPNRDVEASEPEETL